MKSFWLLPIAASAAALCWAGAVGHIRSQDSSNPLAEFAARAQPFSRGETDVIEREWKEEQTKRKDLAEKRKEGEKEREKREGVIKLIEKEIASIAETKTKHMDDVANMNSLATKVNYLKVSDGDQLKLSALRNEFVGLKDLGQRMTKLKDWRKCWDGLFKSDNEWFKAVGVVKKDPEASDHEELKRVLMGETNLTSPP